MQTVKSLGADGKRRRQRPRGNVTGARADKVRDGGWMPLESELWLSMAASPEAADRHLQAALEDKSWRKAPTTWVRVARCLGHLDDAPRSTAELLAALADRAVVEDVLDDPLRSVLVELTAGLRWLGCPDHLGALCLWLSKRAGPGDAAVVVTILGNIHLHRPHGVAETRELPVETWPLVGWLLYSGAAELRQHGHDRAGHTAPMRGGDLLLTLAVSADRWGTRDDALIALRLLLAAPALRLQSTVLAKEPWDLVEKCLAHGLSERAVVDVARLIRRSPIKHAWLPLERGDHPRCREALLRLFQQGLLGEDDADQMIQSLGSVPPPPGPFSSRSAKALLKHLQMLSIPTHLAEASPLWVSTAVATLAPLLRGSPVDSQLERALGVAVDRHTLREEAWRGFELAWPSTTTAGQILRAGPPTHARGMAALMAARHAPLPSETKAADLEPLRQVLLAFIQHQWLDPVCGVDLSQLLGNVTDVRFRSDLPRDLKVMLADGVLLVDDKFPRERLADDSEDAVIDAAVYAIHELVHVAQGFDEMAAVRTARGIGAEMTVMQIDLAADHITTLLLNSVCPLWSIERLKDRTGRGLAGFPAGPFHTEASRQRKATRLVGARFDLAVRRRSPVPPSGFHWLDFSPGGPEALAFCGWPLVRLMASPLSLGPADRNTLIGAGDSIDFDQHLASLDELCGRLADRALGESRLSR